MKLKALTALTLTALISMSGCSSDTEKEGGSGGDSGHTSAESDANDKGNANSDGINDVPIDGNACTHESQGFEIGYPLPGDWECIGGHNEESLGANVTIQRDPLPIELHVTLFRDQTRFDIHVGIAHEVAANREVTGEVSPLNVGGMNLDEGVWVQHDDLRNYYWWSNDGEHYPFVILYNVEDGELEERLTEVEGMMADFWLKK